MREIFVDTSAWYAIEDASDANHDIALSFIEEIAENCHLVNGDSLNIRVTLRMLIPIEIGDPPPWIPDFNRDQRVLFGLYRLLGLANLLPD